MREPSWLLMVVVVVGCGDNRVAPRPLVEDPAVQRGCQPGPVVGTRAKRVACREELIEGRLAAGRLGDFVLENARVRVVIRGPGEGYYLHGSSGGGIVDAAAVGGEDLVKEILPIVDLSAGAFEELVITEAGDDGPAELVVRGPMAGLDLVSATLSRIPPDVIVEHHYRLPAGADAVELETRVFAGPSDDGTAHELYDGLFMGGRAPVFVPGHGFAMGQGAADLIATAGTTSSYGLVYPAGSVQLVDLAGIRIALGPTVDAQGTTRWFVIGDGSVASVTERAWQLRGVALGEVRGTTAPGGDVVALDGTRPMTIGRADATGAFRIAVPPGPYTLRAEGVGREAGPDVAVVVGDGEATATVPAGASGTLAITVRDELGAPIPARVVVERAGQGARIAWADATGDLVVRVEPGTWRVAISRGLEYDAFVASAVVVGDGQTAPVTAMLAHVVDTTGWISLDTHLHSELSTDSTFPVDDRLRAVAAEGVELPVSSDHDLVVDYAPMIRELGLEGWLGSLVGTEASSLVWGHLNAWPLALDERRAGGGSPRWLGRAPGEVFAALHAGGSHIVQVNHPRYGTTSLFDAIDLDPATLVARRDPTDLGLPAGTDLSDLDFDAIEVANQLADEDFEEVFADWLQMVRAGHRAAATGSSDSHGASAFAGEARTYVYVGSDDATLVDPAAVVAAIRARHVVVGTCAFVTAGIVTAAGTSLPGDTVDLVDATVALHVRVQAAAWQPLAQVRIYQGTQQIRTIALDPLDTAPVRFDQTITVPAPAADTFWVIRVDPAGPGDPVLDSPLPAFTNPLFGRVP